MYGKFDRPRSQYRSAVLRSASLALGSLLLLGLPGCKTHGAKDVRGWVVADPTERHPIMVDKREEVLDLSVSRGARGLAGSQRARTRSFMRAYRDSGNSALVIRAPSGSPNEVAAIRVLDDVRRVMREEGVAHRASHVEPYFADGDPTAPVRISYLSHVAIPPECGSWPTNLAAEPGNLPYPNMGCATQRNLAAMVSNPNDLLEPRGMTPRSSERRDTIWNKYVRGEATVAEKADEESGAAVTSKRRQRRRRLMNDPANASQSSEFVGDDGVEFAQDAEYPAEPQQPLRLNRQCSRRPWRRPRWPAARRPNSRRCRYRASTFRRFAKTSARLRS